MAVCKTHLHKISLLFFCEKGHVCSRFSSTAVRGTHTMGCALLLLTMPSSSFRSISHIHWGQGFVRKGSISYIKTNHKVKYNWILQLSPSLKSIFWRSGFSYGLLVRSSSLFTPNFNASSNSYKRWVRGSSAFVWRCVRFLVFVFK